MKTIKHCPVDESLEAHLYGRLSSAEEAATHGHLESCSACRERLEQLAGDGSMWRDAKELLADANDESNEAIGDSRGWTGRLKSPANEGIDNHLLSWMGPTDDPTRIGRVGAFEIIGIIGYGGAGVVLKAHDVRLNRYVAIKVLLPALAHNAAARKRFERESRAVAAITHQNVVPIYAVHTYNDLPYIVMQYVAGISLQQRIDANGSLHVIEIVRIAAQISRALAAAHSQGIIHRDIKPANVLLESNVDHVLVTDFGLARVNDEASAHSGVVVGTPQYMSPEQCHGHVADQRSDLFSLGSVMYAMCVGWPPFRAESLMGVLRKVCTSTPRRLREINPEIPDWLEALIVRLMQKQADRRFHSAAEVAEILEAECAHLQNPIAVSVPNRDWFNPSPAASSTFTPLRTLMMILSGIAATAAVLFAMSLINPDGDSDHAKPLADVNAAVASALGIDDKLPLFESEETRTFAVEPGGLFRLEADEGKVEVFTSDERQVQVKVSRKTAAANREEADKFAAKHRIEFKQDGSDVKVEAKLDPELKNGRGRSIISQIVFQITLPKTFNVNLKTSGGSISLRDSLIGEVRAKTSGGDVTLANVNGPAWVATSGGNITVGDINGAINLHTSGGNVKAGNVAGDTEVKTSGGNIEVVQIRGNVTAITSGGDITLANVAGAIQGTTSGGDVKATISKQPEQDCQLSTSGGDIRVRLAKTLALEIEAKTNAGRVKMPFAETLKGKKQRENFNVSINGGGTKLSVSTSGGNITLEYLDD